MAEGRGGFRGASGPRSGLSLCKALPAATLRKALHLLFPIPSPFSVSPRPGGEDGHRLGPIQVRSEALGEGGMGWPWLRPLLRHCVPSSVVSHLGAGLPSGRRKGRRPPSPQPTGAFLRLTPLLCPRCCPEPRCSAGAWALPTMRTKAKGSQVTDDQAARPLQPLSLCPGSLAADLCVSLWILPSLCLTTPPAWCREVTRSELTGSGGPVGGPWAGERALLRGRARSAPGSWLPAPGSRLPHTCLSCPGWAH